MKEKLTNDELAQEIGLESIEELFYELAKNYDTAVKVYVSSVFKRLSSPSQDRFLNYCKENDYMDAYNFYHSLI